MGITIIIVIIIIVIRMMIKQVLLNLADFFSYILQQ